MARRKQEKDQSPQSRLHALGVARLNLIGKYSSQLMDAYIKGHFDETSINDSALDKLVKGRILHRPDESQPLSLRPDMNALIASLTEDERKRQINADVAGQLEQIRTLVKHFSDAQYRGDYVGSEHHFQLLTEKVHDMTGQFSDAIVSLWNRLNSDFGFVSNLSDKIRENELAQKQLRRLLDGFELIDFNEMIELAQSSGPLRKLLVSQLQVVISDHSSSLLEVQKRLVELMARFRQQQERAQLISNMAAFLKQHPKFEVGDYPNRTVVPENINHAAPIIASASVALDRVGDQQPLGDIVRTLELSTNEYVEPLSSGGEFDLEEVLAVEAKHQQLKEDVENFFISLFDSEGVVSALDYLEQSKLDWDGETWLFQVIAEYEGLARDIRKRFAFDKKSHETSVFNQLHVIEDVHLSVV
ncbi:hypothetical protein MHM98_18570 [Psychrobium sp. MM17-31]|uniref:hypothetical protein n=1 Tax=Psychrobium sp. MM17-31 TaxID=2917758 RepID=UPI001EF6DE56|nr:hypothetical protein [Psychrobium sp. MM17-31]MCG7533336.1 hypothetical protein [Psychrobium sp. MM17-31]